MSTRRAGEKSPITRSVQVVALLTVLGAASALRGEQEGLLAEGTRALYRGDPVAAGALARKHLKTHPGASAGLVLLARAEVAQGKHLSAYQELRKVLRADPMNIDALYLLGRVCLLLSQAEHQALYALAPDSARVHQLLAESYQVQHNRAKAEEEYLAALRADPRSVEVLNALGELKRTQFHFDEALAYYSQAAQIEPRNYDSAYGLGVCYLYQEDITRAVEGFRRALALDPDSAPGRLALGDALLRAGQTTEAVAELKAAAALRPDMRQAYTLLARAYRRLGQLQEAEEARKKSDELTQKERAFREEDFSTDGLGTAEVPPSPEANPPVGPEQ